MRFSANGYYIERYVKCATCGMLVYGDGIAGTRHGKPCVYCTPWCVEWATLTDRENGYVQPADRPAAPAGRGQGRPPRAHRRARPGHDEHPRLDHGVDLPRDGHPADEDVLLDDLQRGPRLHLRARRRQGRHDRLRRVLPDHDRRHAAADQDLRPGDPVRDPGGGRHRPPQRPLPRRAALPRAHLLQAVLQDGRLLGFAVCIGHIAEIGGMVPGAFCGEATEIFHEGLRVPPVKIRKKGQDVEEVWKLLLANVRTPRQNYGDLRAMIGSVDLGVARIGEIVAKYGEAVFTRTCEDLMDYAERRMRAEYRRSPTASTASTTSSRTTASRPSPTPSQSTSTSRATNWLPTTRAARPRRVARSARRWAWPPARSTTASCI